MGIFAEWQPAYAEAGIATFPVDGIAKRPAVGNYLRAGRRASAQWAVKFPEVDALGFACGSRNRLTVLDVDTTDERVLADAFSLFGESPVLIRTASGKFHAWYRHNGEKRKIRAPQIDGPVDILGGGFAVAPPSQGAAGGYEFLEGSLADLSSLPAMRSINAVANEDAPANPAGGGAAIGERNKTLLAMCGRTAPSCKSLNELTRYALEINSGGLWDALPEEEVARTAKSAWTYQIENRNGFAGVRFVQIDRSAHDILKTDPDAAYLYQLLRAEHWGRNFLIANGWHKILPISLARLKKARQFLLDHDLIECIRTETRNRPAVYGFSRPLGG